MGFILFLFLFRSLLIADDFVFLDQAMENGLIFNHDHGGTGQRYYIETIGPGVCLLDFDNDEDLDIYFCQGARLSGRNKDINLENKLFRNELGYWTDVTSIAGVGDSSYSFGCACGDVDNDGDTDLYISNYGKDIFYRNNGDGTFKDMTDQIGMNNTQWGSSIAFFDMDLDGLLDIYITNYVEYSLDNNPWCGDRRNNLRDYCKPDWFTGVYDNLFHNMGNWRFKDVSIESGISNSKGKGLGVIPADFDNDGDFDLYVANDGVMNHYFVNNGKGFFEENAMFRGVGFNEKGLAEAGMGVDVGDVNGDGWQDIFVTNFSGESNTVYTNNQKGFFSDVTHFSGLTQPSWNFVGFGTKLLDLNYDGWLDIFVVNGHVTANINVIYKDHTHAQRKQLFLNNQNGIFLEIAEDKIGDAKIPSVGRGAAFGDLDNDGDLDVVVANNNGPANLLVRRGSPSKNWIGLKLIGIKSNKDAIGSRVVISTDNHVQVRYVNSAGSYLSSNDKRILFGLDNFSTADKIIVYWPSGVRDEYTDLKTNQYYQVTEGGGLSKINY